MTTTWKRLILILSLFFLGWASTAQATLPASERQVLLDLYTSTGGAGWTNKTNWNGPVGTECTWHGITCDGTQGHVLRIELGFNNLVGTLPSLSGLTALTHFYVYNNALTGSIPPLGALTALTYFSVFNNQLTGSIPALGGLTALQGFWVYKNQLTGSIPSLSGLSALRLFRVEENNLSGPVPAAPASLTAGGSNLCANGLVSSGNPTIDAAWAMAQSTDVEFGGVAAGEWLACQSTVPAPLTPIIGNPTDPVTPPPVDQSSYTVNIGVMPDTAAPTEVAGTLGAATVTVQLDLSKVLPASFAAEASYNVYVAALVPGRQLGSATDMWFVKAADLGWQPLTSPIASYLRNVASGSVDQKVEIEIVRDTDITMLIGTEVYIGYGTSDTEMLEARRYRGVFIVK